MTQNRTLIIGASSGMGKALAELYAAKGHVLGLTARSEETLKELQHKLQTEVFIRQMDVTQTDKLNEKISGVIKEMGGCDTLIISAGTGHLNPSLNNSLALETIDTNVRGFIVAANTAYKHFKTQGYGKIVGISSIAALRGGADAPAYYASKACVSNYMEGLRVKAAKEKLAIQVTDIRPGFVDTKMAKGDGLFWVATPEKAARQIIAAVEKKKACAYITKRWRLIACLMRLMPHCLYKRL